MKTINVRELQKRIKECVNAAQQENVLVTRHGKPTAVLIGVEGMDWEHIVTESDPRFWRTIAERRQQRSVSLSTVRRRLRIPRGRQRPTPNR